MPSYSSLLRLALQDTGSNENTWGQALNAQFGLIEDAVTGTADIVLAANDYSLSAVDGSEDEARYHTLNLAGNPTNALSVIVPDLTKVYLVRNNTTGAFDVTVRTLAGSGAQVPRGEARQLYCDGTNVVFAATAENAAKVGGLIPGDAVTRNVDPDEPDGLLDRDDLDARYVQAGATTGQGVFTTGDVKLTFKKVETGWLRMDDGSIGPTNSGATTRSNNDVETLYKLLWDNVDDVYAPVSGGRGASADADWTQATTSLGTKLMTLPKTLGRAIAAYGNGSALTPRDLGEHLGEEAHALSQVELPAHFHYVLSSEVGNSGDPAVRTNKELTLKAGRSSDGQNDWAADGTASEADAGRSSVVGADQPHNTMQPTTFLNVLIKL